MDDRTVSRFRSKVDQNGPIPSHDAGLGPCWLWAAHIDPKTGYGRFRLGERFLLAHRVAWSIEHGVDCPPRHVVIMHRCDRQACVRPSHLRAGTQSENLIDRHQKGRDPEHMGKGEKNASAKMTDELVRYIRANPDGLSMCEIARRNHLSWSVVCRVKRGVGWKHVT